MAGAATVEKALDVLFHLHAAGTALGLSEIGRDLDLPKSSCHRLLASLVERDVVEQDAAGRYRPGLALLALGLGAQAREPVVRVARPGLESASKSLGETVFLVARRRGVLRVLDKVDGTGFLRAAPDVGDEVPSNVTAVGKLYAALTPVPVEGDPISTQGYATNRDAWIEGLSVLAVPIWQAGPAQSRTLVAALALGAASARFESLGEESIAAHLLEAASEVSARLSLEPPASARPAPRGQRRATTHPVARGDGQENRS